MKNYSVKISKKDNDDKEISDLILSLDNYSDNIKRNDDNENYIQIDMEI